MRAFLFVPLALLLGCAGLLGADETPPPAATAGVSAAPVSADQAACGPVAVPIPSEKAMRYHSSGNVLWVIENLWALFVALALLLTGLSAGMRDLARRVGRKWIFVVALYAVLFSVVTFIVDLPLSYYTGFVRQHAYGLSNQTFGKWAGDAAKELMVDTIVLMMVLPIFYLFLRKSPRRWWLWAGLASVPFIVLGLLVSPVWIDPLFNEYGPMKDKALEAEILALADRAGIEGGRVFEVNKSVDTEAVNAYVTGFGQTKRIVLWDTIVAKLDRRELLFVMGHEMGHYVLRHIPKTIFFLSFVILLTLYGAHRTAGAFIVRWRGRIGFTELSDVASLPLILLLASVFSLVVAPAINAYSRWQERESDRFGLEITHDNHAAAMAFVKLQSENLANPRPGLLYKLWRASHPPIGERIDFSNDYRPWESGAPGSYEELFRKSSAGGAAPTGPCGEQPVRPAPQSP